MLPVRQSIQVAAPLPSVAAVWPRFAAWVLTGPRKLACDQLLCIDLATTDSIRFEDAGDGQTTVAFELVLPYESDDDSSTVREALLHDLILFKGYVESPPEAVRNGARSEAEAGIRGWRRRGLRVRTDGQDADPGVVDRPSSRS